MVNPFSVKNKIFIIVAEPHVNIDHSYREHFKKFCFVMLVVKKNADYNASCDKKVITENCLNFVWDCWAFLTESKSKNYSNLKCKFLHTKKHLRIGGSWEILFTQLRENHFRSQDTFKRPVFFGKKCFYSIIYISTLLFNYTQMKIAHLSRPQPNMSSIGEGCNSLGKTSLTSLVGSHWATGGLRVNSC